METKRCSKCGEVKPLEDYHRKKASADGRRAECKECRRSHDQANREQIVERKRAYYQANREQIAERNRAYAQANRKQIAKQKRDWYQANHERLVEKQRAYHQANREHRVEYMRAYRQANRQYFAEYMRAWQRANPDKIAACDHRRRARKACAVPQRWQVDHTLGDPLACWWCGRGLLGAVVHVDHVMPISLGGPADPTNEVMSCDTCNSRKQAKHFLVWIAELVS